MKMPLTRSALLCLALSVWSPAAETPDSEKSEKPADAPKEAPAKPVDPELEAKRKETEALSVENKLEAERLTRATNAMRAEITRLKTERDLLSERQNSETAKRQAALKQELAKYQEEKERLSEESELAKVRAEKLANELKEIQTKSSLELATMQTEIARIEAAEKRNDYTDSKPVYLKKPLKDDGNLVISDRRIPLNGPILEDTATFITSRIQYWNNKDRTLPIFIVIDSSPGGSVMAGYRILKSMESSDAPVHVVVKSFAASMAAAITTLAEESYAYPNAIILHHQISASVGGRLNLTQQREFHQESQRWWKRLGTPIATKMGISTDEFIKRMYERTSSGDWSEFGEDAQKLKWVNHIVQGIDETSLIKDPDASPAQIAVPSAPTTRPAGEEVDADGRSVMYLPRLNPVDVYFMHNPDGYYRMR
jgi:ATP-dependent Clp protease, protease subunit